MKVAEATREQLEVALRDSVEMQRHYAELLNMHDGGERMIFKNANAWLTRLEEIGGLPKPPAFPKISPSKGGVNHEYQIKERPPAPAPIRRRKSNG